jgi:hypothetical protein
MPMVRMTAVPRSPARARRIVGRRVEALIA